ncbi:mobile mystery protein B [Afipia birgiae]|uniref:mobile mystery protein B n=1 Tax=Afipia birgiae TaxID=151414 RepID=UPI0002DF0B89|nr:mobile mystery protein B [Afipia birgiae]
MTDLFQDPPDATPLDPALRGDLIPTWVTTRADLNTVEEENILSGYAWARGRRGGINTLLTEDFSKSLHKRMFGEVWKWAGVYRQNELNIGIEPHLVAAEVPALFDNARFWVENKTFPPDEIAVRLHHRLTQIHGFPNGNGRHSRMMADLLIEKFECEPFAWGNGSIQDTGTLRNAYIGALRSADAHDFRPLLEFARA